MEEHTEDARIEEDAARLPVSPKLSHCRHQFTYGTALPQVKIAVRASLIANFALCILQSECFVSEHLVA